MINRTMKKILLALISSSITITALPALCSAEAVEQTKNADKVRTIVTADWLDDDQLSLVRYLLYANEFETVGLIADKSAGNTYEFDGESVENKEIAQHFIDAYAEDYEFLSQHSEDYPTPEYLTSINVNGSIEANDLSPSEGSEMIKEAILDDSEDTLFIQCWGGCATLGAALKSIEEEYKDTDQWEDIYNKVLAKVVVYHDLGQDTVFDDYILPNWGNISVIMSYISFQALGQTPTGEYLSVTPEELDYYAGEWVDTYITNEESALSKAYHDVAGTHKESVAAAANYDDPSAVVAEGDTPNFLYIYDVGLRQMENPSYGGWGGRYVLEPMQISMGSMIRAFNASRGVEPLTAPYGVWQDAYDEGSIFYSITRWTEALENDFAARMQWSHTSYEDGNHAPEISINEGTDFTAHRGDTITLNASVSDPDGDDVNVTFWQYEDADTYDGAIELTSDADGQVTFTVPEDAIVGNSIHIIAQVTDNGDIPITRYQRVIVSVVE